MLCEQPGRNGTQTQQSSSRDVDAAATALLRFAGNVDTDRHREPAVLGVITSAGYAGRRRTASTSSRSPRSLNRRTGRDGVADRDWT
jgi:hypothetical protein